MRKNGFSTFILLLLLLLGLSLLLYPTFSDYWNSMHQTRAIATYAENVADLDSDKYEHIWNDAKAYNQRISQRENVYAMSDEETEDYHRQLNLTGDGIMGYIEIPGIHVTLPLHHTVEESILQVAVGHIEWTSLPTGGEGNHTVFSGHRGLPSARLFSDLDQLNPGDLFMLRILDELMTYEVDQILVVEPHEVEALQVQEGKDLCTLVTCTPYGVNSHRLLVRGHRVENPEEAVTLRVTADAYRIEPLVLAPLMAVPIFLVALWILSIAESVSRGRKRGGKQVDTDE